MIGRYTRPEMRDIWTEQRKLEIWLDIELLAAEALCDEGLVPKKHLKQMKDNASFTIERCRELERTLNHDVIAFTTNVSENIGKPASRWLHFGLTSSDIIDTAFAVQMNESLKILIADVKRLRKVIGAKARKHMYTPMIGRSHGINAEPTTFGLKLAGWYDDLKRGRARFAAAIEEISVGMLSGAVGTYAFVDPRVEELVCERLGLTPVPVSTQVIPRDRHAAYFCGLAQIASSIERFVVEVRHLQRTEVLEAEERFTAGQKGSSAMPHKRNPILSENLTGLARLVRSHALPAMENVALWHERDISHSSVERVIGPDATIAMHFMLGRLARIVEGLVVYPENMRKNLDRLGGIHFSQRVMLALVESGITREEAYSIVQRNAMCVWKGEGSLRELLEADSEVTERLSPGTLDEAFDENAFVRHRETIFSRTFGE